MKKKLSFLCFSLFFSFVAVAQDYCHLNTVSVDNELYKPGAVWHYSFREGMDTPNTGYLEMEVAKDTTVEDRLCKKLVQTYVSSDGDSHTMDIEIIYYDPLGETVERYFEGEFYSLYDFMADEGAILEIPVFGENGITDTVSFLIDSVRDITIDNTVLKIQYVSGIDGLDWDFSGPFIEGIGAMNYFFPVYSLDCDAGGCPMGLRCYQDDAISYFRNEGIDCEALIDGQERFFTDTYDIKMYPVPVTDYLHIEGKKEIGEIRIYNLQGSLLHLEKTDSEKCTLDCSGLSNGTYILSVFDNNSYLVKSMSFVKNEE